MKILTTFSALWLLSLPAVAGGWAFEESRTLTDVLAFDGGGPGTVEVDNIFGSIVVEGYGGREVRFTARETIAGRTRGDLEEARREVELAVTRNGSAVRLIVDGPFRRDDGSIDWRDRDYRVTYDFELQVPWTTDLELRTVNDGEISVRGVEGAYRVSNVNGGIELKDVAGSGEVVTVNGGVEIRFARNPEEDWSLKTINGDLEAVFEPGLSADFRFKTFNGDVWSDFDAEPRALARPEPARRQGGRFVYENDRSFGVRVATGGPELAFDTLNGNIYLRRVR